MCMTPPEDAQHSARHRKAVPGRFSVWVLKLRNVGPRLHPQTCPAGLAMLSIFLGYRRGILCTDTSTANSQRAWDQACSPEMLENAEEPRHSYRSWFPRKEVPGHHPQDPS